MDFSRILAQLYAERDRVQQTIATLEKLLPESNAPVPARAKGGRKSMGAAERLEVAARMKAYWANRRQRQPTE